MSSSTKRARLRYADSIKDDTEIPDIYNERRKKAQKVRDKIDLDNDGAFADFEIGDLTENSVMDEAFDTYNTMKYFIYNAPLPTTSHMKNFPSNLPRICFLHQLYSVLPDNTAVDRELDILVQNLIVRKFRVGGTLEDELVIMFMTDYMAEILNAKVEFEADVEKEEASTKTKSVHSDLFDRFRETVSNHKFTDVVISRKALRNIAGFSETEISQLGWFFYVPIHKRTSGNTTIIETTANKRHIGETIENQEIKEFNI
ncbi:hypothetical protein INT43_005912 [Umbelopsis isabellina]|uniref:Uncharacterized protein n=1 Tax=Mortierella isabellina TaxID=91625 RepID=A0A8H7PJF2_MORIS|nr:hypothetical protein INT43_005912 [Umbelopsis isabellina]